ncbi:MAG TPA: sigma-70 family RNA polymerase sigma factor [Tepidisphaeraceae bacterium]|jgi:RNA polymerase sigma-70 factor (ECF subfamily)
MESEHEQQQWLRMIGGLRAGDEAAVREFCQTYAAALHRLADRHLPQGLRRRLGAEDVVQSAYRTFFRRVKGGELQFGEGQDLWRLLCAITLTKVHEQARFHLRKKRGLNREVHAADDSSAGGEMHAAPDTSPSPAQAAEFQDQFERLLQGLSAEERKIVELRLADCDNLEVAERLGCSERTVRRMMKKLQEKLTKSLESGGGEVRS